MADEIEPHTIQHDQPAKPDVESREETIERVVHEADEAQNVTAREELVDPTSRRGVNRTVVRRAGAVAAIEAFLAPATGPGRCCARAGGPSKSATKQHHTSKK